jgi:hypothetical protein
VDGLPSALLRLTGDGVGTAAPECELPLQQADLVSVDHPHVVDNYRAAHGTYERHTRQSTSTEDLRQALVCARTLFEELVSVGDGNGRAG